MEKQEFAGLMIQLAQRIPKYRQDFTDRSNLAAWYDPLKDIPFETLRAACDFAAQNLDEFPSIAWLIRKCKGNSRSHEEIGSEIAARIEHAIGAFGWPNPEPAMKYIGELGWELVKQCGGWVNVCNIDSNDQLPSLRKKWREDAARISKSLNEYGENVAPQIPAGSFSAMKFIESVGKEPDAPI